MKITEALVQLRDDLKSWVTNNLKVIEEAIKNKKDFSGKYSDLVDAPSITDNSQDELLVTDQYGNAILQVNENGVHTTDIKLKKLSNESNELLITDDSGNAILLVNETGLNTTEVEANKFSNNSDELLVTDSAGNAILQVDENGINTTAITAKKLSTESDELIITDLEGNTILQVDDTGVKTTEISANKVYDESNEFLITDHEGNTVLQVNKEGTKTTELSTKKINDDSSDFIVTDTEGNTILQVDKNGVNTTAVNAKNLNSAYEEFAVVDTEGNTAVCVNKNGEFKAAKVRANKLLLGNDKKDVAERFTDVEANIAAIDAKDIFVTDMVTVNAHGGVAAGEDLNGLTTHEILKKILYPYVDATVGNATATPNGGTYEHGVTKTITQVSISITKKSEPITSVALYNGSTLVAEKTGDAVKNGGTITFTGLSVVVPTDGNQLTVKVTYPAADGTAKTVTKSTTVLNFVYPYYMGAINADNVISETTIESLTKKVEGKGNKSHTFDLNDARIVFAYPKAHGVLKSIIDPNGYETISGYNCTEMSITGLNGLAQTYYVYVSKDAATATSFAVTFKY